MKTYPIVLTIAGSDSSGGAGIQADIKTMSAIGVYASSAITAVTAQNTQGVTAIMGVDPKVVAAQIDAVFADLHPEAVKIGMLFSKDIVDAVADSLERWRPRWVVLDPVMISTSGSPLIGDDAVDALTRRLIPQATVLTPNRAEAAALAGMQVDSRGDMDEAARRILALGCTAVLMKGGHFDDEAMTDRLYLADASVHEYKGSFVDTRNTHGTGCTLSSAIASFMALGHQLPDAVGRAKSYLQSALEAGATVTIGQGHGPVNHFFKPQKLETI